jgi:predicted ATPase/DNA-binding CsgD family transcriptional regulator
MMERVEQQLGNYRLKQLLGKGAFADVYLGEHLYLNTPVAVKVLHSGLNSNKLADFLTEARHVSHLVHPHIIRVFDFGLESDVPFLVMDYAPNGNLREIHPSGITVPLPTIVAYIMALASALEYAHDQHLIHRDLKPENVLLGPRHEVLLCDFGLALLTSDQESLQVKERFGNLSYMAPELIRGQPVPASDQYALAVMVYEWLCGHLPFEGLSARMSNQHLYTDPPALCEEHPDIPHAVGQVVLKGLSKEPSQRFVDVLSFARALEEASQTVSSLPLLTALPAVNHAEAYVSAESTDTCYQNVPVPLTPLIGREREREAVRELLLRPEVRVVTLTGSGGIGKTHLALSVGNEVQEAFAQGVCFVSLATVYDSELAIPAITQALALSEREDCNPTERLKTFLRDKHLLLILDSFEQVLQEAPLLADLLSLCPCLKILVTSRALLHIGGEYECTLQALEVPDMHHIQDLESLSRVASVALFVQQTKAMLPEFELTSENARDIADICARLEGVPLAIELAAAQGKLFPPKILLSRLEHPLEALTGRRKDAPARQQTLLKTLRWNDAFLSPDEQTLFRRCAVFVGGCSLQAVDALSKTLGSLGTSVLDGVLSLVDNNLLRYAASSEDETRLSYLEMIRAYALKRLTECGELEQTRDAHADYYLAFAEEAESVLPGDEQTAWQASLEREVGNLRAALEWLLERKKGEEALRLASALLRFWSDPAYLSEGRSFLKRALNLSEESQMAVSRAVRAKALYVAGWLAFMQEDPVYATPVLQESLRLFRSLGDRQGEATALTCLSSIFHDRGEGCKATALLKEGVKLYREIEENGENGNLAERVVIKEGAQATPALLSASPRVLPVRPTESIFPPAYEELTPRETEVLQLLATGLSNKQIAERLVLSSHTVNGHIHSIFGKLALNSRSAATRYALEYHIA